MRRLKQFTEKYFLSDALPLGARLLNFVCFLGALATFFSLVTRIIGGMSPISIGVMAVDFVVISIMFVLATKRARDATAITAIALFMLGVVFLPLIYFTGGGGSGVAAYFILVIILDFLLLKKQTRIAALIATSAAVAACYAATNFWSFDALVSETQSALGLFLESVQSIYVAGFFMGAVILFQNGVYVREKNKSEAARQELQRNEELLTLVNEAAGLLLTAEPSGFYAALSESMKKIAVCLDIDCVYIWRLSERKGRELYNLIYDWFSERTRSEKSFEAVSGSNVIPRMPEWDDKLFGGKGYMSEQVGNFAPSIRDMLKANGVQSIMAFPVFFQGRYWGFVTYENRHSEKLCSDREAVILQSGSLLLANAVERHDGIIQLNERLAQQQLMSDISKRFISKEPMEDLINFALANMGVFLNVERVIIAVFEKDSDVSRPEYFWFNDPKYKPNVSQKGFSGVIRELFPRFHGEDETIAGIYCDDTTTYDGGKFKIFLEKGGLNSFICVPIYINLELWGAMSIEKHEGLRHWNENDAQLVSMVSSAISNAVVRDVIERERAAALKQAIAASSAKGDFLSNMSHEIRTPMNAIIGMTSIGKSARTLEKKDYAFDKIDNASRHLLGVINDILDMSKIEANKLELSPNEFGFEGMIQKVVNVVSFRVDERKQHFYVDLDGKIPDRLVGDDQRLAQVITNLLSNAVKFTPEEGAIHLTARLMEENEGACRLRIEVKDTGIGITDEQKARLFRSFEQAEAGTSRKYGGTGLGLAISKRIVEMMSGEIWVESVPERGSTFAFTVNLMRADGGESAIEKHAPWKNIRIFAVDPEEEIRSFYERTAADLGVFLKIAESGAEAIELLNADDDYNVYFIDRNLVGINALDLARRIHADTRRKLVAMTCSSADLSRIEDDARENGVDRFLQKPLFRSVIAAVLNEYAGSGGASERVESETEFIDLRGYTVLLAEDVDINREVIASLLEPTGLTIESAENGAQAVEMFKSAPDKYALIFMDVQMPEMDGYEATRRIRASGLINAAKIPIVAMTANVFREDIERCMTAGMNAHVGKPINLSEVLAALKRFLK